VLGQSGFSSCAFARQPREGTLLRFKICPPCKHRVASTRPGA
jgi:hypothetical protein